jgi:hypothetical protein
MKLAELFREHIWLVENIRRARRITLKEINERWVKTEMSGGLPMHRSFFHRHRNAIERMFGICIECKRSGNEYFYYIENEEVLKTDKLQHWMLDSLSIGNLFMESISLQKRIALEKIPAGKQFLQTIIGAMKANHKLVLTYRKFKQEPYDIVVEPYAIKVFKQRWYLVAKNYKRPEPTIYALDRVVDLQETSEHFDCPEDFDTELFFKDYYGVMCHTGDKAERIVIRAYPPLTNYLDTLPLHDSQKVLESTPEHTDFELYLHPTFDFLQELFAQMHEVEVLEPLWLRKQMKEYLLKALERYD